MININLENYIESKDIIKQEWDENGYVVVDDAIDINLIDNLNEQIDSLWNSQLGDGEFEFCGVVGDDGRSINIKQNDMLKRDQEYIDYAKNNCNWRVHGMYDLSEYAKAISKNTALQEIANLLIGAPSPVMASINFFKGSAQPLHQDQAVFHSYPLGKLIGCWVALEDIHPDSGPLLYYPGSQKEPLFHMFDNYPQTNLRTIDKDKHDDYYKYVYDLADKYEKKEFIAKKGQALMWHAGLIHGGGALRNMSLTRKSYVMHYMPTDYNYHTRVTGPFNW